MILNDAQIEAIRERVAKATPGEWTADAEYTGIVWAPNGDPICECEFAQIEWLENKSFVANAHADIPNLLETLDATSEALAETQKTLALAMQVNSELTEWQPIDSAPRDETFWALVYYQKPLEGKWNVAEALCCHGGWWVLPNTEFQHAIAPTHWFPHPPPPKEAQQPEAQKEGV